MRREHSRSGLGHFGSAPDRQDAKTRAFGAQSSSDEALGDCRISDWTEATVLKAGMWSSAERIMKIGAQSMR
jgi:hypothetical protein